MWKVTDYRSVLKGESLSDNLKEWEREEKKKKRRGGGQISDEKTKKWFFGKIC